MTYKSLLKIINTLQIMKKIPKKEKKKKAIKDIMVENYLIRMKVEKGLSISQIKKILLGSI